VKRTLGVAQRGKVCESLHVIVMAVRKEYGAAYRSIILLTLT
jgi:hypothetical protein